MHVRLNLIKVGIIDLDVSNLTSVYNSIKYIGVNNALIINDPGELADCSHVILPGVGAFVKGMEMLRRNGFADAVAEYTKSGRPLLGICLGMQLLATTGFEDGETPGLGLIPGKIIKIQVPAGFRLPHIGWNDVVQTCTGRLWEGIDDGATFYFVHSYAYSDIEQRHITGTCHYGGDVVATVERENIYGTQFHPEKSQGNGLQLLRNFIAIC